MRSRLIPANEYVRLRWRNGAGWTRRIHAARGVDHAVDAGAGSETDADTDTNWDWRLSIAEIEQAAGFSHFPGNERELVLLHGNGLRLRFDDGEQRLLPPPHGRCRFHGERTVAGEPVDGVVHVFNLLWRPEAVSARLWHRPLVGPMLLFIDPGSAWAVHQVAGDARIDGDAALPALAGGDTALLHAGASRARYVIEGGGEVLLVRIEPRQQVAVGAGIDTPDAGI